MQTARAPLVSVMLVSATALAWEILLVRLFSISHWHHYAYMIISLALLGYGVSGAFLALFQARLKRCFADAYLVNLLLFPLSLVVSYLLAKQTDFNPQEIFWDPGQWARLAGIYLYLALPFFFVANAIGLALMRYSASTARIYGADLLGAAAGSLAIVLVLFVVLPGTALKLAGALALVACGVAALELRNHRLAVFLSLCVAGALLLLLPSTWIQPGMSPYKDLSQALQISGSRVIDQRSSPLGLVTVIDNPLIPLRHAPGLSLNATAGPPPQLGLFVDGNGPSAINRAGTDAAAPAFLDQLGWALPYHLKIPRRVLVIGAGGGSEVLQARHLGARHIDALEQNPQIIELVRNRFRDYSGHLFSAPDVHIINREARGYIQSTANRYDVIQVALVDSFSASAAGLFAVSESYLYTVEALRAYLEKLAPDGYLAISRWIKLPPRDTPRLFATAVAALRSAGVADPGARLALIRSWQTSTLLIRNGEFTQAEIETLRRFCRQRSFDVSYYPGIQPDAVNRYNRMAQPQFYLAAKALLGPERDSFIARYKFNLQPATDDRPYFFQFFRWRSLPEILSLHGRGGAPLLDTAYLVLAATLLQALIASLLLIALPLRLYRRTETDSGGRAQRRRVLIYFTALGLAFLFLEIAFIQKFILFLHHPLYAVAVVLAGFLLFAGAGSLYSQRLLQANAGITLPVMMIGLISLVYLVALDALFAPLATVSDVSRIAVTLFLIAPLAFCMGMPFPVGIGRLGKSAPRLVPWAWGINGCASVISAVMASLLAMQFGFSSVVLAALVLYAIAALSLPD